jgi:type IV pilus assembly protein PilB
VDEELRELISSKASETEIAKLAVKKGMRTMFQDALEKVLLGQTSIEEVFRVTTPL